jgi:hypothetical protein
MSAVRRSIQQQRNGSGNSSGGGAPDVFLQERRTMPFPSIGTSPEEVEGMELQLQDSLLADRLGYHLTARGYRDARSIMQPSSSMPAPTPTSPLSPKTPVPSAATGSSAPHSFPHLTAALLLRHHSAKRVRPGSGSASSSSSSSNSQAAGNGGNGNGAGDDVLTWPRSSRQRKRSPLSVDSFQGADAEADADVEMSDV